MDILLIFMGIPLLVVAFVASCFFILGMIKGGRWMCDHGFHKTPVQREFVGDSFVYRCPRCGRAIFNK